MAPRLGFEPRTWRLTAARSTVELSGNSSDTLYSNLNLLLRTTWRLIPTCRDSTVELSGNSNTLNFSQTFYR